MDRAAAADVLARAYGLTRAEAEVAVALAAGTKAPDIAHGRSISINTVKTFRRRVYDKLGVSDQVELMRELPRLLQGGKASTENI